MNDNEIIDMYNNGSSISYIINKCYSKEKKSKVIKLYDRVVIVYNNTLIKEEIRARVYRVIYDNIKKS